MGHVDTQIIAHVEAELQATGYVVHIREGEQAMVADEPGHGWCRGRLPVENFR